MYTTYLHQFLSTLSSSKYYKIFIALTLSLVSNISYAQISFPAVLPSEGDAPLMDILWVLLAALLVFLMQAGFALLESGSVRTKNTINVMMKNYLDLCIGGLIFYLIGYGILLGNNPTGLIGTSHFLPMNLSAYDWTVLFFQMMFAATTVTIASGAMAERVHFVSYIIAAIFICGLIYPIFASWVWGGLHGGSGWLADLGFIDFAGSTVVHSVGGWIALAGVIVMGPRLGKYGIDGTERDIPGHNLTLVALGGFLLWFGWFGFNAGSTLSVSSDIGLIALNTYLAAAAAAVTWLIYQAIRRKPILLSDTVNVALTGLVAITAGCATMHPIFAILSGSIAAFAYQLGVWLLKSIKADDVVNASAVHAFGGVWGTVAAGLFYMDDMFNVQRIAVQILGCSVAVIWSFGLAWVLFKVLDMTIGLKASSHHEQRGLDYTEHAELGYPEFQEVMFSEESLTNRRTN